MTIDSANEEDFGFEEFVVGVTLVLVLFVCCVPLRVEEQIRCMHKIEFSASEF